MYIFGKCTSPGKRKGSVNLWGWWWHIRAILFFLFEEVLGANTDHSLPFSGYQAFPFVEYMGKGEEKQKQCGWGAHMSVILEEWTWREYLVHALCIGITVTSNAPQQDWVEMPHPHWYMLNENKHIKKMKSLIFHSLLFTFFQFIYTSTDIKPLVVVWNLTRYLHFCSSVLCLWNEITPFPLWLVTRHTEIHCLQETFQVCPNIDYEETILYIDIPISTYVYRHGKAK